MSASGPAIDPGVAAMRRMHERSAQLRIPKTIGMLMRERAALIGDAPAAVWIDDGRVQTYRELDRAADRVASALLARGARKGTHVAVMSPSAPMWLVAWFALARLGAILVPVNGAYTSPELAFALESSGARFLVIDESLLPVLDGIGTWPSGLIESRVFVHGRACRGLGSWNDLVESGYESFEPPWEVTATDLFNLQYTSGTTGPPKACMLTHEYWMRTAASEAEMFGHPLSVKRTLLWQPLFYMAAPWRAFMTFLLGGTVFVPRRMSARRFYGWLRDYRIEYCTFPEWALEHCPSVPREGEIGLRHVHAYGWSPNSHSAFERNYRVVARDSFGMSEVGIATDTPIEAGHMTGSGTCGLPLPMRELRVCDAQGLDVPIGQEGELYVAGRGILDGYYQRPDANVDSFRDRWFRTGDLARRDEAGYLYIVGRIKEVIRRSGESISAREVENVLKELPGVSEVAVVGVPDPQRAQEVKAYLKLGTGINRSTVDPDAVLAHCARSLARFKWPRYIAYVDEFPRTPTRKIAKAELVRQAGDLRAGAFDTIEGVWR